MLKELVCDHAAKVNQFTYALIDGDVVQSVSEYGCTNCTETFTEVPYECDPLGYHGYHVKDGIFVETCTHCQRAAGVPDSIFDYRLRVDATPQKKWDKELDRYRSARRQGIQPEGTTTKKIIEAEKASDNLGKAYNAETMCVAKRITPRAAKESQGMDLF